MTGVGQRPGHITSDGSSPPLLHPRRCAAGVGENGLLQGCNLASDRPQEGRYLAGDRRHDHRQLLAGSSEAAITRTQPDLRLPSDVAHGFGEVLESSPERFAHSCGETVSPGGFNQDPSGTAIAGQGQTGSSHRLAGRALAWHQAEECHELSGRLEAPDIAKSLQQR